MFHFPKELFLPEKTSQLKSCFYCSCSLPASINEHIFNSTWAGSHQTKKLICDECNKSFSEKVDKAFLIYTETVRNAWLIKDKRSGSVPIIEVDEYQYLDVGGELKMHKPFIEEEIQADGLIKHKVSFNHSKRKIRRWLDSSAPEALLGTALSKEEQHDIFEKAQYKLEDTRPQTVYRQLDIRSQYRSAAHTILKCLGFFVPDWVCNEQTLELKRNSIFL